MSDESPQWYWNGSQDPFSPNQPASWEPYNSEDNKIIETNFQQNNFKVELSNYVIYIRERMQVSKLDHRKQRPIKRVPNK